MPSKPLKKAFCNVSFNILGYREDNEWVALALEMDLRGYGKTFEEAHKELQDLVNVQIGFALAKDHPEMIFKPADPIWFEVFAQSRHTCLAEMLKPSHNTAHSDYEVATLQIPAAHVIKALRDQIKQADA
ncbi:MAG: hypothetical protein ABSC60_09135 [Acidobacteriota bacterium]|jgi:hypothetical protein